jgi:hypothetical protein
MVTFLMTATAYVFFFQFVAGIIGICVVWPNIAVPPASKNIDHPFRPLRIFFRIMTACMCNLFSWLVTFITIAAVFGDIDTSGLSNINHALLLAGLPIPLLIVFYWLFAKVLRKAERDKR